MPIKRTLTKGGESEQSDSKISARFGGPKAAVSPPTSTRGTARRADPGTGQWHLAHSRAIKYCALLMLSEVKCSEKTVPCRDPAWGRL